MCLTCGFPTVLLLEWTHIVDVWATEDPLMGWAFVYSCWCSGCIVEPSKPILIERWRWRWKHSGVSSFHRDERFCSGTRPMAMKWGNDMSAVELRIKKTLNTLVYFHSILSKKLLSFEKTKPTQKWVMFLTRIRVRGMKVPILFVNITHFWVGSVLTKLNYFLLKIEWK